MYRAFTTTIKGKQRVVWYKLHKVVIVLEEIASKGKYAKKNMYQAKQVVCPLGLEVQKIHACLNDCMLYRGEHADLQACPVYGAARYKRDDHDINGEEKKKKSPIKMMWYFL